MRAEPNSPGYMQPIDGVALRLRTKCIFWLTIQSIAIRIAFLYFFQCVPRLLSQFFVRFTQSNQVKCVFTCLCMRYACASVFVCLCMINHVSRARAFLYLVPFPHCKISRAIHLFPLGLELIAFSESHFTLFKFTSKIYRVHTCLLFIFELTRRLFVTIIILITVMIARRRLLSDERVYGKSTVCRSADVEREQRYRETKAAVPTARVSAVYRLGCYSNNNNSSLRARL